MLHALLRVLGGTLFFLIMAATVGIPAGKRGPAAAQPGLHGPPESHCPSIMSLR